MATVNGQNKWGTDKNDGSYQAYTVMHTNPLGNVGGNSLPDLDWTALDPLGISDATAKHVRERFANLSKRQKEQFFSTIARTSPHAIATRLDIFMEAMALAREEGNEKWQQIVADVLGPIAKKELELNVIREILELQIMEAKQKRSTTTAASGTDLAQQVRSLRSQGLTQSAIAKQVGISRSQVRKLLAPRKIAVGKDKGPTVRKEAASVERLASDALYREGFQDAIREPASGLKQRFIRVLETRPDVAADLLKGRYVARHNGKSHLDLAAAEKAAGITNAVSGEAERLEKRLAEAAPAYLVRFQQGEFPSIRKAAIAAGLHVDSNSPLMRLKANWKKATSKERRQFKRWMEE